MDENTKSIVANVFGKLILPYSDQGCLSPKSFWIEFSKWMIVESIMDVEHDLEIVFPTYNARQEG